MGVMYKGIELEGLDKKVGFYHSNAMHAAGLGPNVGTEFLDKICEYKRADLSPEQFDEINKLWSVVKMNYQICNGGIHQYFGNGFDEHYLSDDTEIEIFDKDEQVKMLQKLYGFAVQVLPENLVENSKLFRMRQIVLWSIMFIIRNSWSPWFIVKIRKIDWKLPDMGLDWLNCWGMTMRSFEWPRE